MRPLDFFERLVIVVGLVVALVVYGSAGLWLWLDPLGPTAVVEVGQR